jgi:hypothetical protein
VEGRIPAKSRFVAAMKRSYLVRFHMALILVATVLCGLLSSKLLLLAGLEAMQIRYPAAVAFSYLSFFLLVKLWLLYVSGVPAGESREPAKPDGSILDAVDLLDLPGGSGPGGAGRVVFGGGSSGGGGAGGTFQAAAGVPPAAPGNAAGAAAEGGGKAAETAGDALSSLGDLDKAAIVLFLFGLLVAAVVGVGAYLLYQAPDILTEAAFQAALATSLLRRARGIDAPHWSGSVFRATWIPFAVVLGLSIVFGMIAQSFYPDVHTVAELYRRLYPGS